MIEQQMYIKYSIDYNFILDILRNRNKEKINFFIDLNSIVKGFYNPTTVLREINDYMDTHNPPDQLLYELQSFLNLLYRSFKNYEPYFIIFYDDGICSQNVIVSDEYKANRHNVPNKSIEEEESLKESYKTIQKYYYKQIVAKFTKPDLCVVHYNKYYETDLVPYYCIRGNSYDAGESNVLNVILSVDKDLLQTCEFTNTIQAVSQFKRRVDNPSKYELKFLNYDRLNAISYIYDKFEPGRLTAKYIPMILSISGDKSDGILGIKGVGIAKAIKLIETYNIPSTINELKPLLSKMPDIITSNIDTIISNYKMISFEEQIKRLPSQFLSCKDICSN